MKKYLSAGLLVLLAVLTYLNVKPVPEELLPLNNGFKKLSIRDRQGSPMLVSYGENFNYHNIAALSEIPPFLVRCFVYLEDKKFYEHSGVDWRARFAAVLQNARNLRVVRGASTITEQVVRILNPRRRSLWSRWIEGFEAEALEGKFKKEEILEFYLNQIPYSSNRRGIVQAAYTYFNRDIDTLNELEMLSLAYIVRFPGKTNPLKRPLELEKELKKIALGMKENSAISELEYDSIMKSELKSDPYVFKSEMNRFINFVESKRNTFSEKAFENGKLVSTIDSQVQSKVKDLLDRRIDELKTKNVNNGAVLILDNSSNEILAWVNGGDSLTEANHIDAVLAKRQPGSALKPFLYALSLEKGWSASTILDDSPLIQAVGNGMHTYRNYSRVHYGNIRLREALGNSLNIPAIHTIGYVGVSDFHRFLFNLGFTSLDMPATHYGEGLALGNGEVSLFELVKAYSVLAKGGLKQDFSFILNEKRQESERIISQESAGIISDILSDKDARRYEFGRYGVFTFPMQTAVKTGTSTDFHDVWAIAYTKHFTAGIWMGNLNRQAMIDVSGASGPGILLRSIFNELYRHREYELLPQNGHVVKRRICAISGLLAGNLCPMKDEIFDEKHLPESTCSGEHKHSEPQKEENSDAMIMFPTPGLQIAMDPRVPDENEAIKFKLKKEDSFERVEWVLDGEILENNKWNLAKGNHYIVARAFDHKESMVRTTQAVNFYVK